MAVVAQASSCGAMLKVALITHDLDGTTRLIDWTGRIGKDNLYI